MNRTTNHTPPTPRTDGDTEAALDAALSTLPEVDLDAEATLRLRRQARRVFETEHALAGRPWALAFDRIWIRRAEPALLAGTAAYYLIWAVAAVTTVTR
jgi:hypothetical protein